MSGVVRNPIRFHVRLAMRLRFGLELVQHDTTAMSSERLQKPLTFLLDKVLHENTGTRGKSIRISFTAVHGIQIVIVFGEQVHRMLS